MAVWKVTGIVPFPQGVAAGAPPKEGSFLPERLELVSRIPARSETNLGDISVVLKPYVGPPLPKSPMETWEPAVLEFRVTEDDAPSAFERIAPALEQVLDDLAFQLQEPLRVVQLEAVDISPPANIGDGRAMLLLPFPNGYDQWKFGRTIHMGHVSPVNIPELRQNYEALDRRLQHALDWYIKGLHHAYDADQYIAYWVSLELLRSISKFAIEKPALLRCNHEVIKCPECEQATARFQQKASLVGFLASELGVDEQTALNLWDMRQIVHGAKTFSGDQMAVLGELVQVLRKAVGDRIKMALGQAPDAPPVFQAGVAGLRPQFGLGGSRDITEEDLS